MIIKKDHQPMLMFVVFPPKDNVLAIKLAILLQFLEQPYHHQG
jgi:hypothetical protein